MVITMVKSLKADTVIDIRYIICLYTVFYKIDSTTP